MAETFEFEDMTRSESKLSVAVYGPSGSGKTTAAIKLAMGIRDQLYPGSTLKDIGLFIDTERKSSTKAVGRNIGGEVLEPLELFQFEPPFDIYRLSQLIDYAVEKRNKKIIVIDSYTAFWSGMSGILDNVAEIDAELADNKKMYGAWSDKRIVAKKNILKGLLSSSKVHLIICFRAKTEYVMEPNARGKLTPRAVGLKEDMQQDCRYEFDSVLSLDRDTHAMNIVKDRIGFSEEVLTSVNPDDDARPITVEDGKTLARLVSEGLSLEEVLNKKREKLIAFILNEKEHKSSKVALFERTKGIVFTKDYLEKFDYDMLTKIVNYIK